MQLTSITHYQLRSEQHPLATLSCLRFVHSLFNDDAQATEAT